MHFHNNKNAQRLHAALFNGKQMGSKGRVRVGLQGHMQHDDDAAAVEVVCQYLQWTTNGCFKPSDHVPLNMVVHRVGHQKYIQPVVCVRRQETRG